MRIAGNIWFSQVPDTVSKVVCNFYHILGSQKSLKINNQKLNKKKFKLCRNKNKIKVKKY